MNSMQTQKNRKLEKRKSSIQSRLIVLTWCAGNMASTPPAALQAGASGAASVFVERRGTPVLDDGVDRKEVTRKLHHASVVLLGLFGQPR